MEGIGRESILDWSRVTILESIHDSRCMRDGARLQSRVRRAPLQSLGAPSWNSGGVPGAEVGEGKGCGNRSCRSMAPGTTVCCLRGPSVMSTGLPSLASQLTDCGTPCAREARSPLRGSPLVRRQADLAALVSRATWWVWSHSYSACRCPGHSTH